MSSITITFSELTADQAAALVAVLRPHPAAAAQAAPTGNAEGFPQWNLQGAEPPAKAPETPAEEPKPRRTRKAKADPAPAQAASEPSAAVVVDTSATDGGYVLDDVKAALTLLMEAKGMPACRDALSRVGAQRISEVKPALFAKLIEAIAEQAS